MKKNKISFNSINNVKINIDLLWFNIKILNRYDNMNITMKSITLWGLKVNTNSHKKKVNTNI